VRAGIEGIDVAVFPGEGWFAEFVDRINASEEYRNAAAKWEGDVSLVFEAEPDKGVPEDVWGWLDLWHGECRRGRLVNAKEGAAARFVVRAPYSRWKDIIRGKLDPVKGIMQGKLKLRGDLPAILRHVRAANELVHLASGVETEFVDEIGA
jgi:putative sterol carrier protein